jgi:hypothetical protein
MMTPAIPKLRVTCQLVFSQQQLFFKMMMMMILVMRSFEKSVLRDHPDKL